MYVTARTTYAMRALVAMARARPATISAPALAEAEKMPFTFLQTILGELRRARLVVSRRGNDGGYRLARPAIQITVGEVVRAMDTTFAPFGRRPSGQTAGGRRAPGGAVARRGHRPALGPRRDHPGGPHPRPPARPRAGAGGPGARHRGPAGHITINVN